tara:strand:- start:117 stop:860 length:744 start_codon:yes stop_codon:yes gene_type:complete
MRLKIGLNLTNYYSINFSLPKRDKRLIKFIIIHYTGMKKESEAIKRLCNSKHKVSSHYFIKNNGEIINLVPDLYEAWHAGKSSWQKFKSLNQYSIGIEMNNPGHSNGYVSFFPKQIFSLTKLLNHLFKKYKIDKKNVLGHSDIAPYRKKDPGEKFPWKNLSKKRLCKWHNLNENKIKKFRKVKIPIKDEVIFLKNLHKTGYSKTRGFKVKNKVLLVKAFQRRFRQNLINGKIDKECFLISKNILRYD